MGWWGEHVQKTGNPNWRSTGPIVRGQAEELTGITHQQVSRWRKHLQDKQGYRDRIYKAAYRKAMGGDLSHLTVQRGEDEWYTPKEYVDAARNVMGSIDLDPASCEEAQRVVQAGQYFTVEDDGLAHEWHGNVWINPPYGRDQIWKFTSKLCAEYQAGRTSQAILLTHNNTDTQWFHELAALASVICFTRGRIAFYRGEVIAAVPNGQMFLYFGDLWQAFIDGFRRFGLLVGKL